VIQRRSHRPIPHGHRPAGVDASRRECLAKDPGSVPDGARPLRSSSAPCRSRTASGRRGWIQPPAPNAWCRGRLGAAAGGSAHRAAGGDGGSERACAAKQEAVELNCCRRPTPRSRTPSETVPSRLSPDGTVGVQSPSTRRNPARGVRLPSSTEAKRLRKHTRGPDLGVLVSEASRSVLRETAH